MKQSLKIPYEEAKEYIERFFKAYPGVKQWMDAVYTDCEDTGMVWTYLCRPRRLSEIRSKEAWVRARARRQSINSIVQGCKDADSYVLTEQGVMTLRDLYVCGVKPPLISYTTAQHDYTVYETGQKEVYSIVTSHGSDRVTRSHRFFVYDSSELTTMSLEDLAVGSFVLADTPPAYPETGNCPGTVDEAELIGILCGDGSYTRCRDFRICFGNNFEYADCVVRLLTSIFGQGHYPIRKSSGSVGESYYVDVSNTPARQRLLQLGLAEVSGTNKEIPSWIFTATKNHRLACLRGLYDTDGGLSSERYPKFTNTSYKLAEGFMLLSQSLGFPAFVSQHASKNKPAWRVTVRGELAKQFTDEVCPRIPRKAVTKQHPFIKRLPPALVTDVARLIMRSDAWLLTKNDTRIVVNVAEGSWHEREHTYMKKELFTSAEQSHMYRMLHGSGTASSCVSFLNRVKPHCSVEDKAEADNLLELCSLEWARINRIDLIGVRDTMDIEIRGSEHAYIGHGLVQHNSAADIILQAMLLVDEDEYLAELGCRLLLQVHDELLFEVPEKHAELAVPRIIELMEYEEDEFLKVRLPVDAHIGNNWAEVH